MEKICIPLFPQISGPGILALCENAKQGRLYCDVCPGHLNKAHWAAWRTGCSLREPSQPRVTLTVFITPFQLRPQLAFPQLDIERKCLNSEVNRKRATGDKAVPVAGRPNTSAYQQESLHCNRDFTLSLAFLSNKREGCKFTIISDSFTCTKIAPIWCSIKRNNLFYFSENGYYFWATKSHFGILNEWPIIGALFWCLSKTPHEWFSLMLIPLRVKWTAVLNLSVPLRKKKMDKLFNIRCHFTDDQIE